VAVVRILHAVELYDPISGGSQEVVRQISTRLASRGHDVTVATSAVPERRERIMSGVTVAEFDIRGNGARGMHGEVERYRSFVADGGFDVVMLYAAQQWATDAILPVVQNIPAATILAPCGFSQLGAPMYGRYFGDLAIQARAFSRIIVHSRRNQDARWLEEQGLPFEVIPNGADEREFGPKRSGRTRQRLGLGDDDPLVLLVGSHTGLKGHVEAMRAFAAARSCRGGVLLINGNSPARGGCATSCAVRARVANARHRDRRVVRTNLARPDLISAFVEADLLVSTSRVECSPIVLFEAAAAATPFLASDAGNSREIAEWLRCGTVMPWPGTAGPDASFPVGDFAAALDDLLGDRDALHVRGAAGRRAWRRDFTWDQIATRYEALYQRAVTAACA